MTDGGGSGASSIMKCGWQLGWVLLALACTPKTQEVGEIDTESEDGGVDDDESGTSPAECDAQELVTSYEAFAAAIAASDDTYHFVSDELTECIGGSDETGCIDLRCTYATELEVRDRVVTRRRMTLSFADEGAQCSGVPFDEIGDELGTHDAEDFAGSMRTIEELYASCCDEAFSLDDDPDSDLQFSTDENGIMTSCSVISHQCAEDCAVYPPGHIRISGFAVGPLP